MKFTVIVAKDGTPYWHIEGDEGDEERAREMADALDRAFVGYREDEPDEQPSPRFQVEA